MATHRWKGPIESRRVAVMPIEPPRHLNDRSAPVRIVPECGGVTSRRREVDGQPRDEDDELWHVARDETGRRLPVEHVPHSVAKMRLDVVPAYKRVEAEVQLLEPSQLLTMGAV